MTRLVRRDLAGIVHYEVIVSGRRWPGYWTPVCQPNADWLVMEHRTEDGVPTCVWCIAERRFG